jgi:hypothetical protein
VPFGAEATTCTFVIQVVDEDYTVFIAATNEIKAHGRRKLPWKLLACMEASKRDTLDNRVSLNKCSCTRGKHIEIVTYLIKLLLQEEMYRLVLGYLEDCLNKCVTRIENCDRECHYNGKL